MSLNYVIVTKLGTVTDNGEIVSEKSKSLIVRTDSGNFKVKVAEISFKTFKTNKNNQIKVGINKENTKTLQGLLYLSDLNAANPTYIVASIDYMDWMYRSEIGELLNNLYSIFAEQYKNRATPIFLYLDNALNYEDIKDNSKDWFTKMSSSYKFIDEEKSIMFYL